MVVSLLTVLAFSGQTSAQGVNDFVITSFEAVYSLTNEDPQGLLTVTETIELNFSGQNQGIFRAIPLEYGDNDLGLKIASVERDDAIEPYITYKENDNTVMKIGQAGTYLTGKHVYVINYEVENVIKFFDDHDEFFWDINGDQWQQPFGSVSVDLTTDANRDTAFKPLCFTGSFGETVSDCELLEVSNGLEAKTGSTLNSGETLTIVQAYEKGYFTPLSFWEKNSKHIPAAVIVFGQLAILNLGYRKWKKYGKDYKSRGVTAPYFDRPKNVSLMQAAYVADNKLTPQHVSAAIIDLSIRGYIKITETNDKKPKHELELISKLDNRLSADEKYLIKNLFGNSSVGIKVNLEDKKNKLHKTVTNLTTILDRSTKKSGLFELSPVGGSKKFTPNYLLGGVAVFVGFLAKSLSFGAPLIAGIIVLILLIVLGSVMSKRSQDGNYLKEHMAGLKLYLSKAEKERLAAQDAVAAPLAPNVGQPKRNVKFFEKLLPFAVAYGVEKTWAGAFSDIYKQAPDWYQGNWSTFNTAALASSLGDTTKVAATSFSPPSSSGGSGFSGGGFSGGGGGGGGGGGW